MLKLTLSDLAATKNFTGRETSPTVRTPEFVALGILFFSFYCFETGEVFAQLFDKTFLQLSHKDIFPLCPSSPG